MNNHRPKVHDIKCAPGVFDLMRKGRKPFELRQDDRDYQAGDYLLEREYDEGKYTGRTFLARVTYTLRHAEPPFGAMLAAGVVLMGIHPYREPRSI